MTDHQQAAERLAMEAVKKWHPGALKHWLMGILPQLLADQARCKELRERVRQLENSAKFEDGIQKDLKEALVESDKINDTLRTRITELEAEVARLKGELNRFSLTRKIGHSTPQEKP